MLRSILRAWIGVLVHLRVCLTAMSYCFQIVTNFVETLSFYLLSNYAFIIYYLCLCMFVCVCVEFAALPRPLD